MPAPATSARCRRRRGDRRGFSASARRTARDAMRRARPRGDQGARGRSGARARRGRRARRRAAFADARIARADARIVRTRRSRDVVLRRSATRARAARSARHCSPVRAASSASPLRMPRRSRRGAAAARTRFELCVVARLSPAHARAARRRLRARSMRPPAQPVTAIACDTKPHRRACLRRARGPRLDRQAHESDLARARLVRVSWARSSRRSNSQPDAPLRKTCGACARCVDAARRGALRGDYTIDATRMHRRPHAAHRRDSARDAPADRRLDLGMRHSARSSARRRSNAGIAREARRARSTSDGSRSVARQSFLHLRSGEFKRRYAQTAMGWRGAAVLRRNAAVALGNALDRSAVGTRRVSAWMRIRTRWSAVTRPGRWAGSARPARSQALRSALRGGDDDERTRGDPRRAGTISSDAMRNPMHRTLGMVALPLRRSASLPHRPDDLLARMATVNPELAHVHRDRARARHAQDVSVPRRGH